MPLPLADNGKVLITGYIPNLPLAVIGTAVFAFLACAFLYNFFRFYKHRYTLWITLGTLIMVLGFAVRIIMTFGYNATSIPIYSVTTICILVAPCAFIAQNYYVLPKMAEWLDEALQSSSLSTTYPPPGTGKKGQNSVSADCLFLKPRLIGRIFLSSDVVTFLLQCAGSGMTAITDIANICLVGLVAQLVTFSLFIALLAYFGLRVRTLYRPQWELQSGFGWRADWRSVYWATLWTCPCIMIRCIFRVIEFTQGYAGTLRTVEWYFYVFDTLPLVVAIAVWIIVWPSKYLGRPAAASSSAAAGAGYAVTGSSSGGLDMGMQMSGRGLNSGASTGSGASGGSGEALTGKEAMRMTEDEVGMTHLGMGHLQQQPRPHQYENPHQQYHHHHQHQARQGHGYAR